MPLPPGPGPGRKPGIKNSISIKQANEAAKKFDILPLDFFLVNLNDPRQPKSFKFECAKAAAPYVHRKMPIAIDDGNGGPVSFATPEQLARLPAKDLKALNEIMVKLSLLSKADPSVGIKAGVAINESNSDEE